MYTQDAVNRRFNFPTSLLKLFIGQTAMLEKVTLKQPAKKNGANGLHGQTSEVFLSLFLSLGP